LDHAAIARPDRTGGGEAGAPAGRGQGRRADGQRTGGRQALRRGPHEELQRGSGDRAGGHGGGREARAAGSGRHPPGRTRLATGRAAGQTADRQAAGVRPVTLSEGRLSHLSHLLLKVLVDEKLGTVRNDRLALAEAKKALTQEFSTDGRLDQLAR